MSARTPIAPYLAVTDRNPYPLPTLPTLGPAGSSFVDPTFGAAIDRVTDGNTRPDSIGCSFRTPSSPHSLACAADGSCFYVTSTDGTILIVDTATLKPRAVRPTSYIEPQFSFVRPTVMYLARQRTVIESLDLSTGLYAPLIQLTDIGAAAGTYIGYLMSSAGSERVCAIFGGTQQDRHFLCVVFDPTHVAASNMLIVNSTASTLNGVPTNIPLNYKLHHAAIDKSGRYVMLYPTSADMSSARKAPQSVLWDTQTGTFTELGPTTTPYGHDAMGFGVSVNQDAQGTWDADQWQFRKLAAPTTPVNVLPHVLMPREVYIDGHSCWQNATLDGAAPVFTELYQYGSQITAGVWRAWDNEIVAIQTNAPAGADPTVWRFCHHRSDIRSDLNPLDTGFWYQPRVNVSPDGKYLLFTSNWGKTLGVDPNPGDATVGFRQDVFRLRLDAASATVPPATLADVLGWLRQAEAAVNAMIAGGAK